MRDDTFYVLTEPDRKSKEERLIDLRKARVRRRLERTYNRAETIAGIGCYVLLIVALVLIIAGLVGGYINVM